MTLPLHELRAHLNRITYRPGWTLRVVDGTWEGPAVRIVGPVEDAYNPGTSLDIGVTTPLPPMADAESFERWLGWRLSRIENHEMREWLKRDGRPIFDPHAEASA